MIDIVNTKDDTLIKVAQNRWESSNSVWKDIEKTYKKYKAIWKNEPEWLSNVPESRSKVRSNRAFLVMESVINNLTGRPVTPNVLAANEESDSREISEDLHEYFLTKYRILGVKKNIKRVLRYLFLSKLGVLKVFWDREIDDFNVKTINPKNVRFSEKATKEKETEFAIEMIEDDTVLDVIHKFPEKESEILRIAGVTKEQAMINNPTMKYFEVWIGNGVFWYVNNEVLQKMPNPYFDFKGVKITPDERRTLAKKDGRRRREMMAKLKRQNKARKDESGVTYETYLFNHFDRPRKPYIFGTVLEIEDKPTGETTLMDQITPLQEGVDKRKRQIDDNADFMNGITKVDTDKTEITLADARKIHYDASGLVYGSGVADGVTRETGKELPSLVFQDLEHSINEIDEIFGSQPTFRGDAERAETATGRAILREQSLQRLDEMIDFVDFIGYELYNWWMQMIKVRYTESHMVKAMGTENAERTVEIMQDDIAEGVEVHIIPGQVLPDDKVFRAERAREDAKDGLIDPVTYLEAAGGYDNPEEIGKRMLMFKMNPLSIFNLDEEDFRKIVEANNQLAQIVNQQDQGDGQVSDAERAQLLAQTRQRIEQLVTSPEFQALEPEQKLARVQELKQQLQRSTSLPAQ